MTPVPKSLSKKQVLSWRRNIRIGQASPKATSGARKGTTSLR